MTELELRKRVVEQAFQWLGRCESNGTHKEIIDIYNQIRPRPVNYKLKYTDPWCAAFVSAVAQKLGLTKIILPECGCDRMIALYRKAGRYVALDSGVVIQPGDLVFYDWDKDGSSDHVGLISEITAAGYRVIEGNKSDSVSTRTVLRNYNLIKGFALPDYAAAVNVQAQPVVETAGQTAPEILVTEPQKGSSEVKTDFSLRFRTLKTGCRGEDVRTVQRTLKALGFNIGRYGTDGEFGNDTKQAVIAYQKSVRLSADGIVGPQTMATLTGGSV